MPGAGSKLEAAALAVGGMAPPLPVGAMLCQPVTAQNLVFFSMRNTCIRD